MPKSVNHQSVECPAEQPASQRTASAIGQPTVGQSIGDLERWIYQTIARKGMSVQYRVRGNSLHLLCRQPSCPDRDQTLLWLIPHLQTVQFNHLLPTDAPPLYQVWVYGCQLGDKRPRWTATLYLNQLERQLAQLQANPESTARPATDQALGVPPDLRSDPPLGSPRFDQSALMLSNVALAKRGEELAIACYLSETLNDLGVAVRVSAKVIPYRPSAAFQQSDLPRGKRLWVSCEAAYSPDPALLSEPITQKLRELEIAGFHDAVIRFQVTGESQPDWRLRVDLTPPSEMLREWARWGDLEAIQVLLNQALTELQLQITTATVNATTLHLCCSDLEASPLAQQPSDPLSIVPVIIHRNRVKTDIGLVLESIAPQGIHAATIYGQIPGQADPSWVEWLDLPATQHPAFAESTLTLAKQGDWGAVTFLLHRLLNPNLSEYLACSGIRLQLLPKQDLLHVMCEAPICPDRKQTASKLARFLRQLELPAVAGVRFYGRRAGQKQPIWSYGLDFLSRSRLVPEVTPEFAATDAFVEDLLPQPGQGVIRPDLTPADLQSAWQGWQAGCRQSLQQLLLRSQIFSFAASLEETPILPGQQPDGQGRKVALVWGAAGLVLLLQSNWLLNQMAQVQAARAKQAARPVISAPAATPATAPANQAVSAPAGSSLQLKPSPRKSSVGSTDQVFDTSGFTQSGDSMEVSSQVSSLQASSTQASSDANAGLPYIPQSQSERLLTAEILAEGSPLPSFNSQQMDQKLHLYHHFVETSGAPDVLIVGSSRALRGIDPKALESALTDVGIHHAKIFNFGINGATAQVVNLLVQHLLTAEALPRMIIWADGARAFNSGTVDVTYNGVVASEAYRQLLAGTLPSPKASSSAATAAHPAASATQPASLNRSLTSSYESIDRWLSQQLKTLTGQKNRDPLKRAIQQGMVGLLPPADLPESSESLEPKSQEPKSQESKSQESKSQPTGQLTKVLQQSDALPDTSGFLSLPTQFNPATYYQQYARVLGNYDSDYENFRLIGNQEAALQSLLKFTEASQIPLIFVNLPLTEDYLDPVRLDYEQQFRDYMVQLSLDHASFAFRDLSEQWTTQYRYFSDPSHLNRYGAYALSLKLAQDAKIPWRKSEQATQSKQPTQAEQATKTDESSDGSG